MENPDAESNFVGLWHRYAVVSESTSTTAIILTKSVLSFLKYAALGWVDLVPVSSIPGKPSPTLPTILCESVA